MEETSWKVLQHIFVIAKREKYYELHNLWAGHNIEKKKKKMKHNAMMAPKQSLWGPNFTVKLHHTWTATMSKWRWTEWTNSSQTASLEVFAQICFSKPLAGVVVCSIRPCHGRSINWNFLKFIRPCKVHCLMYAAALYSCKHSEQCTLFSHARRVSFHLFFLVFLLPMQHVRRT